MPTYTSNYSIPKPTNNGDATVWGTYLNSGMDIIDGQLYTATTTANNALPKAGGTLTGGLTGTSASFSSTLSVTGAVSYAARQTATILASTVAGDYLQLLPTDLGVGKAGFYIAKSATPGTWNFNFYDGASNSGTLQVNSVAAGFSGNVTVGGTLGVTGNLTVSSNIALSGGLVISGNIVGSANSSAYTIAGGSVPSNGGSIAVYGSTAAGAPGTIQFFSGTGGTSANVGSFAANGTFAVNNNATVGGTLTVTGALSAGSATGAMVANAATTLTGSSTSTLMTPGGFAGNSSIGASGYYKLPGGLIVQWGNTGAITGSGTATVTFPLTFTSVYNVQATKLLSSGPVNDSCNIVNLSLSGVQITNGGTAANNVYWIAVGS